jgi:hypothetical protein
MTRLDIEIDKRLDERFRNQVFKRFGLKRGNISTAVSEALTLWLKYDGRTLPKTTSTPKNKAPELITPAS